MFVCLDEKTGRKATQRVTKTSNKNSDVGSANNGLMVVFVDDKEGQSHLKRASKQDGCSSNIDDPEHKKKARR